MDRRPHRAVIPEGPESAGIAIPESAAGPADGRTALLVAGMLLAAGPLTPLLLAPLTAVLSGLATLLAGLALLRWGLRRLEAAGPRFDRLTGLPDRAGLRARLGQALHRARRGEGFALCYIDITRLRSVNRAEGHSVGDAVLRDAARRLRGGVRDIDLVASLGGDQFAVLLSGVADAVEATSAARRLVDLLSEPFSVGQLRLQLGACAGVVLAGSAGVPVLAGAAGIDRLVGDAELALDRAKRDGNGGVCVFEPEWEDRARCRSALEADLRLALERGELELHYQPLVHVRERRVDGLEALLRWRHHRRGMISPVEFIPLAEEAGLIGTIGAWALRAACTEAAQWGGGVHVAVNLSPVQVAAGGLVDTVREALYASGLEGTRLVLEITESVLLDPTGTVLAALHGLRAMGVRIALDDFGTGYSSLSYLRSFPFDTLKIDRSFVSALDRPGESDAIVRAIVAMGESLGMTVTAEGVETPEQLAQLISLGCTHVQGFFFSPPCPSRDVPALLAIRPRVRCAAA